MKDVINQIFDVFDPEDNGEINIKTVLSIADEVKFK
jgi:Ca2+-binding EF-hand superfamily protein